MGVGLGVVLIVAGAVILWALDLNLDFVDDSVLGLILIVAGAAAVLLSLIINAQHSRQRTTHVEERRYGE